VIIIIAKDILFKGCSCQILKLGIFGGKTKIQELQHLYLIKKIKVIKTGIYIKVECTVAFYE